MQSERLAVVVVGTLLVSGLFGAAVAWAGETRLVSVTAAGTQAAGDSNLRHGGGALSADGRFVAFHSFRPSLVRGDLNGVADVFLRDLDRGVTRLVSASPAGGAGNGYSDHASVSADGSHVSFVSVATDLVAGDRNGAADVYVWNRASGALELASVATDGRQGDDASLEATLGADGRHVAFTSFAANLVAHDTNDRSDVFLRDREAGYTELVSVGVGGLPANGYSWQPCVSDDGRYVAYYSTASNLVPDDRGGWADVFVRDRRTGQTRRASVAAGGTAANGYSVEPALSGDGRYVAFVSTATNLVPGDSNARIDVFVKDLETGDVERVSVASGGAQANGGSYNPTLSRDGRYVAFESFASNLVRGDTNGGYDVFVHDRRTRTTRRASVASNGAEADGANWTPSLSADGRYVAFRSDALNLTPLDGNGSSDVYRSEPGAVAFTIKPDALDFGPQPVGTTRTLDFWLRNKASVPLAFEGTALRGPDPAVFAVSHNCGASVPPGEVCRLRVTFRPAWAGALSAELRVRAGGVVRTRALAGVGT